MKQRPVKDKCNECGREVSKDNDFRWIELKGVDEGMWYPCCQYCRAKATKKLKKITA